MGKKEIDLDNWVRDNLKDTGIIDIFAAQGSRVKEIQEALRTASKAGTGNVGRPEFVGVDGEFVIVIEDKASPEKHMLMDDKELDLGVKAVKNYAVNGAVFYARHIVKNTTYKKIFAVGISGDDVSQTITPVFVDSDGNYSILSDLETFVNFRQENIDEYYLKEVLKQSTPAEITTQQLLKIAKDLHEDFRNYGALEDKQKPIIVSGILLALSETKYNAFSVSGLIGDSVLTDGQKIYEAIAAALTRANVTPHARKEKLLNQFNLFRDNAKINTVSPVLGKTPLKYFTEILNDKIYRSMQYQSSSEDFVGRFYAEFMSYSGGDGQTLGIILTPAHITDLFSRLLAVGKNDSVLDPCCGTAGFLISAMHHMCEDTDTDSEKERIKKEQLHGIELQEYMFTIAETNMILRSGGSQNIMNADFLAQDPAKLQLSKKATVGMINPPYSQGSKNNPELYEINFIKHLLDSVLPGGRVAAIVPQSAMTGKTTAEKALKKAILKYHTLEGVITLNKNTFYGVGVNPCIVIFKAGVKHPKHKKAKFINFEDDGYVLNKHIGLVDDGTAKDKLEYLIEVCLGRIIAELNFCVESEVEYDDEWLHSFYYFNDTIYDEELFENMSGDFITFEVDMITHTKSYLFDSNEYLDLEETEENEEGDTYDEV